MKAIARKEGTIYGSHCYVRSDEVEEGIQLGPRREAFEFESFMGAGRWVDVYEGDFVIEPARTA